MFRGKLAAALAAALAALAIIIIIIAINICLFSAVHSKEPLEEKSQYTFIRTNSLLTVIAATTLTSVLSRCPGAGAGAGGWGVEFIVFIGRLSELQRAAPWAEQRPGHHTQSLYRLRNQLLITNHVQPSTCILHPISQSYRKDVNFYVYIISVFTSIIMSEFMLLVDKFTGV